MTAINESLVAHEQAEREATRMKKQPKHLILRQQMKDQEAIRVLCIEARNMLTVARTKAKGLPEEQGKWPANWLDNAIRHLDLVVQNCVENEI